MPKLFGRTFTRRQLLDRVGDISQLMHARRAELTEGFARGADLIEVFNASGFNFSVLPGRALDISSAHFKGQSLCFRSGPGDVGPAFYEPEGFKWGRGWFGGLVTTCGMDFVGHPEVDPEVENVEMPLHGRLSYIPAKNVGVEAGWEGEDYVLRIRGQMRQSEVFLENLEMTREIRAVLGENRLQIRDRVENFAADPSPLMIVYHCNPGFPLLDQDTHLVLQSRKSTEWQEDTEVSPADYAVAKGPQATAHDDVYVHRPLADRQGNVHVGLLNNKLGIGLYWKFKRSEIPIVNQWQHFHKGTYVTGIEPGNCSVLGRAWNRRHRTLEHIGPGEVREFNIEIGVLDGAAEMRAFEREVKKGIVGGKKRK